MESKVAKQVLYSGDVQGHGFRYAVYRESLSHDVTGEVQNRPDGRVEVKVMGYAEDIDKFLRNIRESPMGVDITDEEAHDIPPLRGMSGFKLH